MHSTLSCIQLPSLGTVHVLFRIYPPSIFQSFDKFGSDSFCQDFQCFWEKTIPRVPYSTIFADIILKSCFLMPIFWRGHNIYVILHTENVRNMVIGGLQRVQTTLNGPSLGYSDTPFPPLPRKNGENYIYIYQGDFALFCYSYRC